MDISIEKKEKPSFDRLNPFPAVIRERWELTKKGSSKKTFHLSLDLQGSGLSFAPGDSIGIYAENDPELVERHIKALKASGEELIFFTRTQETLSLRKFLASKANLARLSSSLIKESLASMSPEAASRFEELLKPENKSALTAYLNAHEPLDLLKEWSGSIDLQQICNQFSPLLPRFYSVASSPKTHPDEVHLTVALTTFSHGNEIRYGVASHFLCHLAKEQSTPIPVYVQPAHSFFLPHDHSRPIIMVGPGTGVAPFRAFLQERHFHGAPGKNWLFFGERNRDHDFLYEEFFSDLQRKDFLRLDLAFSRDQEEKVYVQHKMLENADDLWNWLQEGAYFYVCGDAKFMAKDVEAALHRIIQEKGKLSQEEAKSYIKTLRSQKRYLADVY